MDRLSDCRRGMDVVIKADMDWRDVGRPLSCNAFAIATFSNVVLCCEQEEETIGEYLSESIPNASRYRPA